jgi:haloacetate dehalogenase
MERLYDVEEVWRGYAEDVRGKPIDAGHFLAEEKPDETAQALARFLGEESI